MAYVILLGDVGSGKSTLVEKLTGRRGRSSDAAESFTRSTEVFSVQDGSLIIADTPGANCMDEKFQQNLHIAHAMDFQPISSVLLVVKAEERIDNVVENVTKYAEGFLPEDFPLDLLGVCITHMDTVKWDAEKMRKKLDSNVGIQTAVFTGINTTQVELQRNILNECKMRKPVKIEVDSEMFLRLFKVNNSNLKILRDAKNEVAKFDKMKQDFYKQKTGFSREDQTDMIFEFQEFMRNEIIEAQKRLSDKNNFQLLPGPEMAGEAGHIANMTNQLRLILQDVRIKALEYNKDVDTLFKACNFCGTVWQKVQGCEGSTTCGERPSQDSDDTTGMMATFRFFWNGQELKVSLLKKEEKKKRELRNKQGGYGAGCGKTINWGTLKPIQADQVYSGDATSTKDVKPIPANASGNWKEEYDGQKKKMGKLRIQK